MPGVTIMISDTIEVGKTDLKWTCFQSIDIPVSEKKILFRALGLKTPAIY